MRSGLQLRALFSLIVGALIYGCSPYITPHLPMLGSKVRYEVIALSQETQSLWQKPKTLPHETLRADEYYDYVLGAGDTISLIIYTFDATGKQSAIRVYPEGLPIDGEDEFLVAADGSVTLPYVGTIQVAGKPFSQVQNMIGAGLSEYFLQPQYAARIAEFAHGRVLVSGEVQTPGEVFLSHTPLKVSNAITKAGGLLATADLAQASIRRADGTMMPLDLRALFYEGDARVNPVLYAGDTLLIPRGEGNQIFVTGEVLQPQALTMHPMGFSLMEALQQAGGIHPISGDPSQVYVLRGIALSDAQSGKVMIYHLDASDLAVMALADAFSMQPRDIIYVSAQPITQWDRIISQLIPGGLSTVIGPQVEPRL